MSTETPATLSEQVDFMLMACSDYGVSFHAKNAAELISGIDEPEDTAQQLEEMARLIRLHSEALEGKAA